MDAVRDETIQALEALSPYDFFDDEEIVVEASVIKNALELLKQERKEE